MFRQPKFESYFSKNNKKIETYYWAGFLQRKQPFYFRKDRKSWYIKLEVNNKLEDQLWKFLKCVKTIKKVKSSRRVMKCINFKAHQWKLDIDKNYAIPLEGKEHSLKNVRAFVAGWIDAGGSIGFLNGTHMRIKLSTRSNKKQNKLVYSWLRKQLKTLFLVKIREGEDYIFTKKEVDFFISQLMINKDLHFLLSNRTKEFFYKFKEANSS